MPARFIANLNPIAFMISFKEKSDFKHFQRCPNFFKRIVRHRISPFYFPSLPKLINRPSTIYSNYSEIYNYSYFHLFSLVRFVHFYYRIPNYQCIYSRMMDEDFVFFDKTMSIGLEIYLFCGNKIKKVPDTPERSPGTF